jgi:NifU-like protein involved in Fe-S cluster formation
LNKYYSRAAIDHFLHPRNSRAMSDATGVGSAVNKAGDTVRFYTRVEGDVIESASFEAQGCAATIAAASIATELIIGKAPAEVLGWSVEMLSTALGGLPQFKVERAVVALSALHASLGTTSA